MKHVRVLALLAALVAFAAPAAHAQSGNGQGRGGNRMEMLMQGITLTDAQKTSVDSIVTASRALMPPMQQGTPPDSATRAKRMEIMQNQLAAVRKVLTPEQQKVFDENLKNMPPMGGRPRP